MAQRPMRAAALVGLAGWQAAIADYCEPFQFEAPKPQQTHEQWLSTLNSWRDFVRKGVSPSGEVYEVPQLEWTRTAYIQTQIHLYDRTLWNGECFTVDAYLDDLERRFGGLDSVLVWASYTNLGIDERNQFDLHRALPGGLENLAQLTADFHRRGVRVLWGYNPWDNATRQEGEPHWDTLARLLKLTNMDGYNGDTMAQMPHEFWQAGLKIGHPIAGEPEGGGFPCEREAWDTWAAAGWTPLGWGYFDAGSTSQWNVKQYTFAPGVDKQRWIDPAGRHLTHVCDRWSKNRTQAVQLAFFNANGYNAWENIWGLFNQVTDRDAELIRRVATILRWAGKQQLTTSFDKWVPHPPEASHIDGVFASRFESRGRILWLLINRGAANVTAMPIKVHQDFLHHHRFLDLHFGLVLKVNSSGYVHLDIESGGISALLATKTPQEAEELMAKMKAITTRPLAHYSAAWHYLPQHMVPIPSTPSPKEVPANMVLIPRGSYHFTTSGTELEGGCTPEDDPNGVCCQYDSKCASGSTECQCGIIGKEYFGIDVQFPWETAPTRNHVADMELGPFLIDKDLVTNADYLAYLNASGYQPKDRFNWLRHWMDGRPVPGDEMKPVVNVGLDEARDFCNFYGKRLPHSYEWQYAAQGTDGRKYPWGNAWDPEAVPSEGLEPAEIGTHPRGDSPFGVRDMVGNVWQYTDAFEDDHTRSVLLRGSSRYRPVVTTTFPSSPQYANWYFPPALELNRHSKYFLMSPSYERAGTLGFRCVADVADGAPGPFHYRTSASQPHLAFV